MHSRVVSLHRSTHPPETFTSTINLHSSKCFRLSENFLYFIRNVRTRKRTHVQTLLWVETHRTKTVKEAWEPIRKTETTSESKRYGQDVTKLSTCKQRYFNRETDTRSSFITENRTFFPAIFSTLFTTRPVNLKPSNRHFFFSFTEGISGSLWHFQGRFTQR